jgi:hypothetical protein
MGDPKPNKKGKMVEGKKLFCTIVGVNLRMKKSGRIMMD